MIAISCNDVTKNFDKFKAIDRMSFDINANTITGLIGRNGAGKTSLLKTIAGYWRPDSGSLEVFGRRPFNSLEVSANCIMIDDGMLFPATLNLGEILKWSAAFYPNWDGELARRLFDYFEFPDSWDHGHLSKGRRSTFNMIIGLAARCPLTLFDEPTTGMDAAVRPDFYRALLKDYLANPRTIILSSHHIEEVDHLLENVLLVDRGACKLHLSMEELRTYAVSFEGDEATIANWTADCEILAERHSELGTFGRTVSRSTISNEAIAELKRLGVRVTAVPAAEVCMLLTSGKKGGIDRVFADDFTSN